MRGMKQAELSGAAALLMIAAKSIAFVALLREGNPACR
ncbi:hypothetical protein EDF56_11031 [Novosphingobium sp. PhB165]|nr:hypothetical protein EDF56_11031 [Novosphingobium sp. PhB165]